MNQEQKHTEIDQNKRTDNRPLTRGGTLVLLAAASLLVLGCGGLDPEPGPQPRPDDPAAGTRTPFIQNSNAILDKQVVVFISPGCTGTLLNNKWVLTAGHCVDSRAGNPGKITVTSSNGSTKAAEVHLHPSFMIGYGKQKFWDYKAYDIALLRLAKALPVDGSVHGHQLRLHDGAPSEIVGKSVYCYGYGNTKADPANGKWSGGGFLQMAQLSYASYSAPYLNLKPNGSNQIQLKGDSGGPCVYTTPQGQMRLTGVQSWVSWNSGGVNNSAQTAATLTRDWMAQVVMQHDVQTVQSGKCLRVEGGSKANFARVEQRTCKNGGTQRWRLAPVPLGWYPGGYSEVYQIVNVNSGRCLDLRDWNLSDGAVVQQFGCHGGKNQMFTLHRVGSSDNYSVRAVYGGRCLDITAGSKADGAKLQLWDCHGGKNQQFRFRGFASGGFDFEFARSNSTNSCADVASWSKSNGANIQQYTCHGGANQRWDFGMVKGDAHRFWSKWSYRCMDVANFSKSYGANVQQYTCHSGSNQQWDLYYTGKGYHVKNRHSGKCLQTMSGSIKQGYCGTSKSQRWSLRF